MKLVNIHNKDERTTELNNLSVAELKCELENAKKELEYCIEQDKTDTKCNWEVAIFIAKQNLRTVEFYYNYKLKKEA